MKVFKRITVVLLILAVLIVPLSACERGGSDTTAVVKTDNITVTTAMMTFFYNSYLNDWYTVNGAYLSYYSLDPQKDLSEQTYGKGYETAFLGAYDGTWYDYFLDQVKLEVETYVIYADYARECGLVLNDDDQGKIDEIMIDVTAKLREEGVKHKQKFGVDEETVRSCYELVMLANKGMEKITSELEDEIDDSAINKTVAENNRDFCKAKYLSYKIMLLSTDYNSESEFEDAIEVARTEANKISEAKTAEEFAMLVFDSKHNSPDVDYEVDVDALLDKYTKTSYYDTDSKVGYWLFEDKAERFEVKEFESLENKKEHDQFTLEICMVLEPAGLDHTLTSRFAYLIAQNRSDVESLIREFESGKKSVTAFYDIAEKQYAKMDEKDAVGFYYGYADGVDGDYFNSDYEALNDWLFGESIATGTLSDVIEITFDKNDKDNELSGSYSDTITDSTVDFNGSYITTIIPGGTFGEDGIISITPGTAIGGLVTTNPGANGTVTYVPGTSVNGGSISLVPGVTEESFTLIPSEKFETIYVTGNMYSLQLESPFGTDSNIGGSDSGIKKSGQAFAVLFFESYGDEIWYYNARHLTLSRALEEWTVSAKETVEFDLTASTLDVVVSPGLNK